MSFKRTTKNPFDSWHRVSLTSLSDVCCSWVLIPLISTSFSEVRWFPLSAECQHKDTSAHFSVTTKWLTTHSHTHTHTHTSTPPQQNSNLSCKETSEIVLRKWGADGCPHFSKISSFWMSTLLLTHIRVIMCAKRPKGFQSWTSAGGSIWMHCWSIKGRRRKRGTLCSEATQTECTLSLIMQAKTKRRQLVKNCLKHLLLSLPQRSSAVYFLYRYKDICAVRSLDSIMHCQNKYELLWFSCGLTWKTVKHSEHAVVPLSGSKSVFLICSPWPQ